MTDKIAAIQSMSFEQALKELELIVRKLETGQSELEQSIADHAYGLALKKHCEAKLSEARMKVEKMIQTEHGATTTPFEE